MAATMTDGDLLRRKDRVVAAIDMPAIPAGTPGKVTMVAGFDWVRYWVRFENGVTRGSLGRHKLARPGEPVGAEREALLAAAATPAAGGAGDAGDGAAAAAGDGGDGVTYAGVVIPAHLLDRAKNRRATLGR